VLLSEVLRQSLVCLIGCFCVLVRFVLGVVSRFAFFFSRARAKIKSWCSANVPEGYASHKINSWERDKSRWHAEEFGGAREPGWL